MKKTLAVILVLVTMLSLVALPVMAAPTGKGPDAIDCDASLSASVVKNKGNTNTLTIIVNGEKATFTIANNEKGVFKVAGYEVYVATYGNVKIAECYFVGAPVVEPEPEPEPEEPEIMQ